MKLLLLARHHALLAALPLAAFSLATLPVLASAQMTERNPLRLHNGEDVYYPLSVPQTGADYAWKVFPKEALRHPSGVMNVSGIEFRVYDRTPATPSGMFELLITTAIPSATNPGVLEPDFGSVLAIVPFNHGITVPLTGCTNNDALITVQPAPPLQIPADGATDIAIVIRQPLCTAAIGPCGQPDCTWITVYSNDETGADPLGSGSSPYGGIQSPALGGLSPDAVNQSLTAGLQFIEPILAVRTGVLGSGTPQDLGLAGLNIPLSVAPRAFAYTVRAVATPSSVAIAASSIASPFAGAGIALYGAGWLLNPSDPAVVPTLRVGTFTAPTTFPTKSLMCETKSPLPLNAGAIGLTVSSHALVLDVATGIARSTNLVKTALLP